MTDSPTTKGICEIRVKSDSLLQSGDRIAISTGEANRLWGVVSMVASLERINKIILQQPLVQVGRNNPSVVSRGAGGRGEKTSINETGEKLLPRYTRAAPIFSILQTLDETAFLPSP